MSQSKSVVVYSRRGCHLCEEALSTLANLRLRTGLQTGSEAGPGTFEISEIFIDGDSDLEVKYGDQVPVIVIDGKVHDFYRVDPERFLGAISK
jgi:glutaredoxin